MRQSRLFPTGRRQADREPEAAFEVTLWRALAVFRLATLTYAVILTGRNFQRYDHPYLAWAVIGLMIAWSLATISAYGWPSSRTWQLFAADLLVTAACVLSSLWIVGQTKLSQGTPTLTITWMACPVVAVAIGLGRWWGATAALAMGVCDLAIRGLVNQGTITATVIMVTAAIAVGHIATLAEQAQERLRQAAQAEAANRERERLARGIHDSVLQVLSLVQKRGAELGGEAAEIGRLAGEQEAALRALVNPSAQPPRAGAAVVDLREVLVGHASAMATLSAPATGVWLPAGMAHELGAAVAAAVENVRRHCPDDVRMWILVEDEPAGVIVTVRDEGPGIPAGRLDQAAAQGRLGVAQSIRGRLADLGGTATITSAPGQGTEVELRLGRPSGVR
jgi:signal transduction histidine kinase